MTGAMTARADIHSEREEWALLYTAFVILRKETERALATWNITISQGMVLIRLDEAGEPLPINAIARFLLQESPSITTLVDRMCERGLVERIHDPTDRRKALVGLTDKGRQMREDIRKAWRQTHGDMFSVFYNEERSRFKELLTKFRDINIKRLR